MTARYAIYFTLPQTDPLYRLASDWLGYDAYTGDRGDTRPAQLQQVHSQFTDCTRSPAKYGFHATLKPPFRLQPDKTAQQLVEAIEAFAKRTPAFECSALKLKTLGHFLALVPEQPCAQLDALAGDCVQQFDPFRANLTPEEYQKRKPDRLSERQLGYLDKWGYPYVLDEFRFHMTLTNSLPEKKLVQIEQQLKPVISPVILKPLNICQIHLFKQDDADYGFRIISMHELLQ